MSGTYERQSYHSAHLRKRRSFVRQHALEHACTRCHAAIGESCIRNVTNIYGLCPVRMTDAIRLLDTTVKATNLKTPAPSTNSPSRWDKGKYPGPLCKNGAHKKCTGIFKKKFEKEEYKCTCACHKMYDLDPNL